MAKYTKSPKFPLEKKIQIFDESIRSGDGVGIALHKSGLRHGSRDYNKAIVDEKYKEAIRLRRALVATKTRNCSFYTGLEPAQPADLFPAQPLFLPRGSN